MRNNSLDFIEGVFHGWVHGMSEGSFDQLSDIKFDLIKMIRSAEAEDSDNNPHLSWMDEFITREEARNYASSFARECKRVYMIIYETDPPDYEGIFTEFLCVYNNSRLHR